MENFKSNRVLASKQISTFFFFSRRIKLQANALEFEEHHFSFFC